MHSIADSFKTYCTHAWMIETFRTWKSTWLCIPIGFQVLWLSFEVLFEFYSFVVIWEVTWFWYSFYFYEIWAALQNEYLDMIDLFYGPIMWGVSKILFALFSFSIDFRAINMILLRHLCELLLSWYCSLEKK